MTFLKRLKWIAASLAVIGAVTSAVVWGDVSRRPGTNPPIVEASKLFSDEVVGRFTDRPLIAYQAKDGDVYFALQVKPKLPATVKRPRDIAVMVDASASQAGAPFEAARFMARDLVKNLGDSDRVSIWTVSTPKATRNLMRGGGMKSRDDAPTAIPALDAEYASGAVDLKAAIESVVKEFDNKQNRQQVIVYLGDGESALNPLDEAGRTALAGLMRSKNIAFHAVPLGSPMNAANLHTLVTGTGGALVRPGNATSSDPLKVVSDTAVKILRGTETSVMIPTKTTVGGTVMEMFPTKLPPLREGVPTLLVGRFAKGKVPAQLEVEVQGTVGGEPATVKITQAMAAPATDHYFLSTIADQWRASGRTDLPAMLQADRTLALAYENTRLVRDEFVEQGNWALGSNRADAAKKLYEHALKIDPTDSHAEAGLRLVDRVNRGEITVDELKKTVGKALHGDGLVGNLLAQGDPKAPVGGGAKEAPKDDLPKIDPAALLKQEEARQKIREQQTSSAVDETLNRARDLLKNGDPKTAKDVLVAQRDSLRVVGDVGDNVRQRLLGRIESLLGEVSAKGDAMIRQRAEENERVARARLRLLNEDQAVARDEKIRERIKNFTTLMNQARFEDAYREALVMENEFVNEGKTVPIQTQATYRIGQAASNYREFRELVRLREDRFLMAMMEVEKSHMPYPDEPVVHFPPAKVWRELSTRRTRYVGADFGRDQTPKMREKYYFLQKTLSETIELNKLGINVEDEYPFGTLLKAFQEKLSARLKRDVTLYINLDTFPKEKAAGLKEAKVNLKLLLDASGERFLPEVTFKTILDVVCRSENVQANFWVTPDFIEIVSQKSFVETRELKVFPVEDLIVPIPNAVNSLAVQQSLQTLGQLFNLGGGNAFGAAGAFGGGIIGQQQGFGQGQGGQGGGAAGQVFQGGQGVLGFNGAQGFAGQQIGGQFGFQGGPSAQGTNGTLFELLGLIQYVVDQGYWEPDFTKLGLAAIGVQQDQLGEGVTLKEAELRNRMFINLSTRSLIIHGRSRLHPSGGSGRAVKTDGMAALPRNGKDAIVAAPKAGGNGNVDPRLTGGGQKWDPAQFAAKGPTKKIDPETVWRETIDRGITDPRVVIACADYLAQNNEFKHAAEVLKASLRKGVTPERWYQEALAIALEAGQGSAEEIERARLSAIDTEPKDAKAYLSAAKALADIGQADMAVRLCKTAAKLEPNIADPLVNALVYASSPNATPSFDVADFAAGGLLGRDWAMDNGSMHAKAKTHLDGLVKKLRDRNLPAEAEQAEAVSGRSGRRDLVIELQWSGQADLDLRVVEPSGAVCSSLQPVTTGGGALRGDVFDAKNQAQAEVYSAAQAFSGNYKVVVDRISGSPLGGKASVKVTRFKGTPQERTEFHDVVIDRTRDVVVEVKLAGGSRTEVAALPSPVDMAKYEPRVESQEQVVNKLRAMVNGTRNVGFSGGTNGPRQNAVENLNKGDKRLMEVSWQSRLGAERSYGMDFRAQTTIRTDGNAEVKAAPLFDTVPNEVQIKLDLIPGSGK